VIRIGGNGNGSVTPRRPGRADDGRRDQNRRLRGHALEGGPVGNDLAVEVTEPEESQPPDTFRIVVKRGEQPEETFDNLTVKRGRQNAVTVVNAASKLIQLEEIASAAALERPAAGSVASRARTSAPSRLTPTTTSATPATARASAASSAGRGHHGVRPD